MRPVPSGRSPPPARASTPPWAAVPPARDWSGPSARPPTGRAPSTTPPAARRRCRPGSATCCAGSATTPTRGAPTCRSPSSRRPHEPRTEGVHVTWFGHASCLVELDGVRLLMDPVWSERCSPSQHVGPRRLHAVPVPLAGLGRIDAVVISHDHYDHLDMDTIRALVGLTDAVFLVPLGVGAHLDAWGVPAVAGRRVRLGGGPRRPWRARHRGRGPALLRAGPAARRHPVGLVGARGAGGQGLLQWRQRILRRLRPARLPSTVRSTSR